jgi:hypothetical protein
MAGLVVRADPEGRPVPPTGLDVYVSVPDAGTFAAAAREWLAELPGLLAPGEWEEVLRNEKPPFSGKPEPRWPDYDEWVEPFTAWGKIVVAPLKWNGIRVWQRPVTRTSLEWLAGVLADRPVSARISICRVDADGIQLPGGVAVTAEAGLGRQDEVIPVGRLGADDSLMWRAGARLGDADGLRERQVSVARAWAGRPGVLGLFAGEDTASLGGTALADSLEPPLKWERAVLERELPGYSWITLCPEGATGRLGGAAALRQSAAFWRVDEQPGGAVLLQATERLGDYGLAAARKVFDALAPVLPEGVPGKPPEWPKDVPWLIIPEDAASRRTAGGS